MREIHSDLTQKTTPVRGGTPAPARRIGKARPYEEVRARARARGPDPGSYAKVSRQYDIDVQRNPGSDKKRPRPNAVAVRFSCRPSHDEADAGAGAYLLRTSRTDWSLRDIVQQYLQITEVDLCQTYCLLSQFTCAGTGFRKSGIGSVLRGDGRLRHRRIDSRVAASARINHRAGAFSRDLRAASQPFRIQPNRVGWGISSFSDSSSISHSFDARSVSGGRWRCREVLERRCRRMV